MLRRPHPTSCILLIALLPALPACGDQNRPSSTQPGETVNTRPLMPITQALKLVQQRSPQGRLIELDLENSSDGTVWDARVLEGREVRRLRLDAVSGELIHDRRARPDTDDLAELMNMFAGLQISMAEAVRIAMTQVPGGNVYEAEVELEDGKPKYEIELTAGERVVEVELSGVDGRVMEVHDLPTRIAWDLELPGIGRIAGEWSMGQTNPGGPPGRWQVAVDAEGGNRRVLTLVQASGKGQTYNVALAPRTRLTNLDASIKVKANSGEEDQGGGLVWRAQNENTYYICRVNPLEDNYRLYKVVNGKRTQLASADVETESGKWYSLRVVMIGDRITCYLEGKKLLEASDTSITEPGMIGVWTKADAATSFTDLRVERIPPLAPAPGAAGTQPTGR